MWEINPLGMVFAAQALVLLLVCLLLIAHVNQRKKYAHKLEEKITDLRLLAGTTRRKAKRAEQELEAIKAIPPKLYLDFVEEQLDASRDYHQGLNPDRDIVLDIEADVPLERRIVSLRYAFLIAEASAHDQEATDWAVLQEKLEKLIEFYGLQSNSSESADPIAELESAELAPVKGIVGEHNEYMSRLHEMAAEQQLTIKRLMDQLAATSDREPELKQELQDQLNEQQRFVDETRMCIELLENELARLIEENEALRRQGAGEQAGESEYSLSDEDRERLEGLLSELTEEGKKMMCALAGLENENRILQDRLEQQEKTNLEMDS